MHLPVLAKLEERGDKPLRDFLNQLVTWPLLNDTNWDEQRFNLTDLLVTLSLYSNHPLVSVSVNPDVKNSSARILYVSVSMDSSCNNIALQTDQQNKNKKVYIDWQLREDRNKYEM